jgi:hypothetical protein
LKKVQVFDAAFHCYSTAVFSCLLVLFEKFRCFSRVKHFKEGMQMTRQFYFEVTFEHDIETGEAKKRLLQAEFQKEKKL